MSAIRALRQIAVPLVARRSAITATAAVPRVGGMRVASLASSRTIASRGFASSTRRFGEGSSEQFVFFWSMPVRAALLNWGVFFSRRHALAKASRRVELRKGDRRRFRGSPSVPQRFQVSWCMDGELLVFFVRGVVYARLPAPYLLFDNSWSVLIY